MREKIPAGLAGGSEEIGVLTTGKSQSTANGKTHRMGLTTLIGSFTGSYFASYLKKKGENRAIHEDLSKLVDQVTAVLQTVIETLGGWGHFVRFALYNRAPMRGVADT